VELGLATVPVKLPWALVAVAVARRAPMGRRLLWLRLARWVLELQAQLPVKSTSRPDVALADGTKSAVQLAAKVSIR
jgi:hypothetical protein